MKYKPKKLSLPKFRTGEAKTPQEKLILELVSYLHDNVTAFIKLNRNTFTDKEIFLCIRDGALAFVAQTIEALIQLIQDEKGRESFLEECQEMFYSYMERISPTSQSDIK